MAIAPCRPTARRALRSFGPSAVAGRSERPAEPAALEITCSRFLGHFVGDPQGYRLPEELAQARGNDPIPRFRKGVTEAGLLDGADLDAIETEVLAEVESAVAVAMAADRPDLATLETDVYVRY